MAGLGNIFSSITNGLSQGMNMAGNLRGSGGGGGMNQMLGGMQGITMSTGPLMASQADMATPIPGSLTQSQARELDAMRSKSADMQQEAIKKQFDAMKLLYEGNSIEATQKQREAMEMAGLKYDKDGKPTTSTAPVQIVVNSPSDASTAAALMRGDYARMAEDQGADVRMSSVAAAGAAREVSLSRNQLQLQMLVRDNAETDEQQRKAQEAANAAEREQLQKSLGVLVQAASIQDRMTRAPYELPMLQNQLQELVRLAAMQRNVPQNLGAGNAQAVNTNRVF